MRGQPRTLLLVASSALVLGLVATPAAAQVFVTSCADVAPAGVEVEGETAFAVALQRDPSLAASARIDFTAFDPDNINPDVPDYDGSEVLIRLEPSGYELPDLDGLTWGDFHDRSSSFTAFVPLSALQLGTNQVVFIDMNGSPFAVERLCVTLEDAPVPDAPPAGETFCARDVYAPSAIDNGAGEPADIDDNGGTATIEVELDVPLGEQARVGLDVVAFLNNNSDEGNRNALFSGGGEQLGATFLAPNVNDHFLVRTAPVLSGLFGEGGEPDAPLRVELTAAGDFDGRYWSACFLVEDDFAPPLPDAGPPEVDAGVLEPPPDGGPVPPGDAGAPDAGPAPGFDAGLPEDGLPEDEPPEDGGSPRPGEEGPPLGDDEEARVLAQLSDPDFRVSSSCAAAPGGTMAALGLLLWSFAAWPFAAWPRSRRRRRAR